MIYFYNKTAKGHIIDFDIERIHKQYKGNEIKHYLDEVERIKQEEFESFKRIYHYTKETYYDSNLLFIDLCQVFDSKELTSEFHHNVLVKKLDLVEAYKVSYRNICLPIEDHPVLKKYKHSKFPIEDSIKKLRNRIVLRIELMMFVNYISRIEYDCILQTRKFKKEYFHFLTPNIKGLIFNSCGNRDLAKSLAYEYELPTIITDKVYPRGYVTIIDGKNEKIYNNIKELGEPIKQFNRDETIFELGEEPQYEGTNINIYVPMVDLRNLEKVTNSHWYTGISPFKSEFMFMTKGTLPTIAEQVSLYTELLSRAAHKEIYIRIPDFRPERPTEYLGEIYTDLDHFKKYSTLFTDNLTALAQACYKTQKSVNIIIPMIRIHTEIKEWRRIIHTCFNGYMIELPQVGIMIETESAFQFHEDYKDMDFVMIGLNDLIEESFEKINRYSNLSYKDFTSVLLPELRDLHQYLRSYGTKVKHIIGGNILRNPEIFERLLKVGFTDFSIPLNDIRILEPILKARLDRKGMFVGLAAERKEKEIKAIQKINEDNPHKIKDNNKGKVDRNEKNKMKRMEYLEKTREKRNKVLGRILSKKSINKK